MLPLSYHRFVFFDRPQLAGLIFRTQYSVFFTPCDLHKERCRQHHEDRIKYDLIQARIPSFGGISITEEIFPFKKSILGIVE